MQRINTQNVTYGGENNTLNRCTNTQYKQENYNINEQLNSIIKLMYGDDKYNAKRIKHLTTLKKVAIIERDILDQFLGDWRAIDDLKLNLENTEREKQIALKQNNQLLKEKQNVINQLHQKQYVANSTITRQNDELRDLKQKLDIANAKNGKLQQQIITINAEHVEPKTMQIYIKNILTERIITLEVNSNDSIKHLKAKMKPYQSHQTTQTELMFAGTLLEDKYTLSYYNIPSECTIHADAVVVGNYKGESSDKSDRKQHDLEDVMELEQMRVINDGSYAYGEYRQTGWIVKNISNKPMNMEVKLVKCPGTNDVLLEYENIMKFILDVNGERFVGIQVKAPLIAGRYSMRFQLLNDKKAVCGRLSLMVVVKTEITEEKKQQIQKVYEMGFTDRSKIITALEKWQWDELKAVNWLATH